MKRKILSGVFALALLVTAGFGVNKSMKSDVNLNDLALANVEALAQTENEEFNNFCAGSWNPTRCKCANRAYTFAVAVRSPCYTD